MKHFHLEKDIIKKNELLQIENNILRLKQQTVQNIIQIGLELIKAKEKLSHGEWGKWLEEKIEFSQRTANQLMRIAKEFGSNSKMIPIISNLDITKVYLLMELPTENRDDFIANNDLKNMTTREIKKAIKQLKNKGVTPQQQIELFNKRISTIDKNIEELVNERKLIVNKLKSVFDVLDIEYPPTNY